MTKKRQSKTKKLLIQFVEYAVAGGVWFWSGYIIIVYLDDKIPLFWANLIGNAVGISLNFLLSRYWAFKTKRPTDLATATRRYVVYTLLNAFLLNYLILQGLRSVGIEPEIGQFIAAGFFSIWNFVWYRLWVFKGVERPRKVRLHA